MNEQAKAYWDSYWKGKEKPESVKAWSFGTAPDRMARLVMDGVKTATCSARQAYEVEKEALPEVGEYNIILNGEDEPAAIIRTTEVEVVPFNEVTEEFARAEGEGDLSYHKWLEFHKKFFKKESEEIGYDYSEDMDLVCERFQLVHVNPD
ncbi:ASCH domain-containing protein [Halobacillus sp. Nhm2S1]|uniref:ASCH domain-containing protein n=1 Tax=Halobacillus sp. Nhm2S1 TaxID=2866716 RepID=UPI001C7317B8|nr:ASCH domain-containing protein [Halobacillus sp. Nhm2S1]MBX0356121.1 ASCH domain-containing protein [Halobacillus sp. Nhm2S1]